MPWTIPSYASGYRGSGVPFDFALLAEGFERLKAQAREEAEPSVEAPPTPEEWEMIRAARRMQNEEEPVNPWERKCGRCGHQMRAHRLDWSDPMAGLAPDCGFTVVVVDPDTLVEHSGPCPCVGFEVRSKGMGK